MNTNISQTILNKIQKENIKPKARWYFVIEHAVLWIPGVLVTVLGAVAVAGMIYAIVHSGWEYYEFIYRSQLDFVIASAPFVWILSFVAFNSLIVQALRTTHQGYRLSAKKILFGSVIISSILGVFLYITDERFKAESIIRYPVHMRERQVWMSPQEGRIVGKIEKVDGAIIILRDKNNMLWDVDISGFGTTTFPFVKEGESIRVIGTSTGEIDGFVACALFPWELGGRLPNQPLPTRDGRGPKIKQQHTNPDCKSLLNDMKQRVRLGERK